MTGEIVMNEALKKITAPLLFRLIDESPHLQSEKKSGTQILLHEFHEQIRRDLEHLLNTRLNHIEWSEKYHELNNSVINYGISDFTLNFFGEKNNQHKLCQMIKEAMNRFEPRIHHVHVIPIESDTHLDRVLKLRIECEIDLQPTSIPAVFESRVDVANHMIHVE